MLKSALRSYPGYFQTYVEQVKDNHLQTAFDNQRKGLVDFFKGISEEKSMYAYGPDKWTIKGVLQHIIDAERIFTYRALCFARKDNTALPGWEEVDYGNYANAERRSWDNLIEEFTALRQSTELLYKSFTEEMLSQEGTANSKLMDVATIGFTLLGHAEHHKKILIERYF